MSIVRFVAAGTSRHGALPSGIDPSLVSAGDALAGQIQRLHQWCANRCGNDQRYLPNFLLSLREMVTTSPRAAGWMPALASALAKFDRIYERYAFYLTAGAEGGQTPRHLPFCAWSQWKRAASKDRAPTADILGLCNRFADARRSKVTGIRRSQPPAQRDPQRVAASRRNAATSLPNAIEAEKFSAPVSRAILQQRQSWDRRRQGGWPHWFERNGTGWISDRRGGEKIAPRFPNAHCWRAFRVGR